MCFVLEKFKALCENHNLAKHEMIATHRKNEAFFKKLRHSLYSAIHQEGLIFNAILAFYHIDYFCCYLGKEGKGIDLYGVYTMGSMLLGGFTLLICSLKQLSEL